MPFTDEDYIKIGLVIFEFVVLGCIRNGSLVLYFSVIFSTLVDSITEPIGGVNVKISL